MALAYGGRRTTDDCDAWAETVDQEKSLLLAAVAVAKEESLPQDWLNFKAKERGFVTKADADDSHEVSLVLRGVSRRAPPAKMKLVDLTRSVLNFDDLAARQWVKDALRSNYEGVDWSEPTSGGEKERVVAAALAELLCNRAHLAVPTWTSGVEPATEDLYLERSANEGNVRLRALLKRDAPEPLKRRNVFAPGSYLEML